MKFVRAHHLIIGAAAIALAYYLYTRRKTVTSPQQASTQHVFDPSDDAALSAWFDAHNPGLAGTHA